MRLYVKLYKWKETENTFRTSLQITILVSRDSTHHFISCALGTINFIHSLQFPKTRTFTWEADIFLNLASIYQNILEDGNFAKLKQLNTINEEMYFSKKY